MDNSPEYQTVIIGFILWYNDYIYLIHWWNTIIGNKDENYHAVFPEI